METLERLAHDAPRSTFLIDHAGNHSTSEFLDLVRAAASGIRALGTPRLYLHLHDSAMLLALMVGGAAAGVDACVLSRGLDLSQVLKTTDELGAGRVVSDEPDEPDDSDAPAGFLCGEDLLHDAVAEMKPNDCGNLIILTSGTTGSPKAAVHSWERLLNRSSPLSHRTRRDDRKLRWLLAYPLNHFAGIQMFIRALTAEECLVIPHDSSPAGMAAAIEKHEVTALSATPTFWRNFLGRIGSSVAAELPLEQITMGGEPTTAEILTKARAIFPNASISHVYATTELGACFSVKDGMPGFPTAFLDRRVGNSALKIVDGELWVHPRNPMTGYLNMSSLDPEQWHPTGDLIEVRGERVHFLGRKEEIINVGGVKVHPAKVEEAILNVEGVFAVRVFGRENPVTGQVVAAEVEADPAHDRIPLEERIMNHCASSLNRYELPRDLRFVESLARRNEKIARHLGAERPAAERLGAVQISPERLGAERLAAEQITSRRITN